ncbi:MAG: anhydro-N-acetylmuramic acid kinase [Alphaproteobacteria bacterium]|nr:anhydro-N-acetylmuramic acid kinase [Alphaproteobacteria bacterium]
MTKYRIIGNMTGNSMDAIDLILTEFDGDAMTDICSYTKPYTKDMQERVDNLRKKVLNKTKAEIEALPEFKSVHDDYVKQIAECINEMCELNKIDKKSINAIGFHGKTLDHNPPSKAKNDGTQPYTLQIGSGQMLADLTGIPVVYDFRSDPLMQGFDGAPLVPPHNAHISVVEGDGCYYNGGNTSNLALIIDGTAQLGADAGPFNEYTDNYIRSVTGESYDKDGKWGKKGQLNEKLLQNIFACGRTFYETPLPKSGDPAYYHRGEIFEYVKHKGIKTEDAIHTFEYSAAYIAVQALTLVPDNIKMPEQILLFGGGWKNPVARKSFEDLLNGRGFVLPEHEESFAKLRERFAGQLKIKQSIYGDYMEARLFADLARYKLENKAWEIPEVVQKGKKIICGRIAEPKAPAEKYNDCINRAAKGWQQSGNVLQKGYCY